MLRAFHLPGPRTRALAAALALACSSGASEPSGSIDSSARSGVAGASGSRTSSGGVVAISRPIGAKPLQPTPEVRRSAVDGADPWGVLGALTGSYLARVSALTSDCVDGPEVPFDASRFAGMPFRPISESYWGTLEQRGDEVVFEIGEGLIFARVEGQRLIDVVRVAGDGVTQYHDGLDLAPVAGGGFRVSGETDWTFESSRSWRPETCSGRTAFEIEVRDDRPVAGARDLHVVLRWPVTSSADLDLMVQSAESQSGDDRRAFLGEVQSRCHVLHSAGTAGGADDADAVAWIHPLQDTDLAHHEEIIRCASGKYGTWHIDVVNWSGAETVDFELEFFEGPTVGLRRSGERRLGIRKETVAPHARRHLTFDYVPPPSASGAVISSSGIGRPAMPRPRDPISGSVLGFDKAAALGVSYAEFLANVGL